MPHDSIDTFADRLFALWADPDPSADPVLHRAIDDLITLGRDDALDAAAHRIRDLRGEEEAGVFTRSVQAIAETTPCILDGLRQSATIFAVTVVGPQPNVTMPRHLIMNLGCSPLLPDGDGLVILDSWYGFREIESLSPSERRRLVAGIVRGHLPDLPPHDSKDGISIALAAAFEPEDTDPEGPYGLIADTLLAPDVHTSPGCLAWRNSMLGGPDGGGWRGAVLDILAPCPMHLISHALARSAAAVQAPQRPRPRPAFRVIQGGRA